MRKTLIIIFVIFILTDVYSQTGWFSLNSPVSHDCLGLYFINENTGWVAGWSSNILKTTNGGNTWIIQNTGSDPGYQTIFFYNEQTGWLCGGNTSQGTSHISKTTNSGNNWNQIFYGNIGAVYNVSFINALTGWFACEYGNVMKTTDGGATYTIKTVTTIDLVGIKFIDANTGWVNGNGGKIYKTTDGGLNWVNQITPVTSNLHSVFMFNNTTGFSVGYNGTILKTTNSGNNWLSKPSPNTLWLNQVQFINTNTGYICGGNFTGSASLVMVTTNEGENWAVQNTPFNNWLSRIQFLNQNTGYACGRNGTIIKTTTGGFNIPTAPLLVSPANNSINISPTPILTWNSSSGATMYKVQISTVPIFSVISDSATITSTSYNVPSGKLSPGYTYYWRVNASNNYGTSPWSSVWNFSTSVLPSAPNLISPPNGTIGTPLDPTLTWSNLINILAYHIEISTVPDFAIITDSVSQLTNQYIVPLGKLSFNITYYWRVNARNSYGWGPYSSVWYFIPMTSEIDLISSEIPDKYLLYPNYPNPFNPNTKIRFSVPEENNSQNTGVKLLIFDLMGREIETLVNFNLQAGTYEVEWNAEKYSSGIYFYRMQSGNYIETKRMILLK